MNPKAILFDLDDTLIPSAAIYPQAVALAGLTQDDFCIGRTITKERLGPGHVAARNRLLYLKATAESRKTFRPSATMAAMGKYEAALFSLCRQSWHQLGRRALLSVLAQRCKLGLITNETTRAQLLKVAAFAPDDELFQVVVTSEEIGAEKPDERIFREALGRLAVEPADCVMVGNDPVVDLCPARAIGMRSILCTEFIDVPAGGGEFWEGEKVRSLAELPRCLGHV